MRNAVQDRKVALRHEIRQALAGFSAEERVFQSTQACALLKRQDRWKAAQSILFYAPLAGELDVWPLFQEAVFAGKVGALPRYVSETRSYVACQVKRFPADVHTGQFGIREPVGSCQLIELNRLDLVLVPGVAFDPRGRRLGRGKGFYDQLLPAVSGKTCGVAFDEQIVRQVPVEPHDVQLNCILTPTRWIEL